MPKSCDYCGAVGELKSCAGCALAWYCSVDHQRASWKDHKDACKRVRVRQAWSEGLTPTAQREWLIDCYRMRVDDLYVWGGGQLRGLYDPERTAVSIARHFLLFCKLAAQQGVVPRRGWDWAEFLTCARSRLAFAFEKKDAQDKYGGENVFDAAVLGGRSLRFTGETVYGSGAGSGETSAQEREVDAAIGDDMEELWEQPERFRDVGGIEIWLELVAELGYELGEEEGGKGEGDTSGSGDDEGG
eukprot:jgi/Mesvir1/1053/Mv17576-RA.1